MGMNGLFVADSLKATGQFYHKLKQCFVGPTKSSNLVVKVLEIRYVPLEISILIRLKTWRM